jgi:DNA excision repair protein ERCC-3
MYICNPNKLMACEYLMKYHEKRGDKIIIFSDDRFLIDKLGKFLERPFIHGDVSHDEQMGILSWF